MDISSSKIGLHYYVLRAKVKLNMVLKTNLFPASPYDRRRIAELSTKLWETGTVGRKQIPTSVPALFWQSLVRHSGNLSRWPNVYSFNFDIFHSQLSTSVSAFSTRCSPQKVSCSVVKIIGAFMECRVIKLMHPEYKQGQATSINQTKRKPKICRQNAIGARCVHEMSWLAAVSTRFSSDFVFKAMVGLNFLDFL